MGLMGFFWRLFGMVTVLWMFDLVIIWMFDLVIVWMFSH